MTNPTPVLSKPVKKKKVIWVAHYGCGCIEEASIKRDLTGYCGIHGDDLLEPIMKMESNL